MFKEYYGKYKSHQVDLRHNNVKDIEEYFKKFASTRDQAIQMANVFIENAIKDNVNFKELYATLVNTPDNEVLLIYSKLCNELSSSTAIIENDKNVSFNQHEQRNVVF